MDRYNFSLVEEKWQKYWEKNQTYKTIVNKDKKKILRFRNASISFRKNTHGTCKKLYHWRRVS